MQHQFNMKEELSAEVTYHTPILPGSLGKSSKFSNGGTWPKRISINVCFLLTMQE